MGEQLDRGIVAGAGVPAVVDLAHATAADDVPEPIEAERVIREAAGSVDLEHAIEIVARLVKQGLALRREPHRVLHLRDRVARRAVRAAAEHEGTEEAELREQMADEQDPRRLLRTHQPRICDQPADDRGRERRLRDRVEQEHRERSAKPFAPAEEVQRERREELRRGEDAEVQHLHEDRRRHGHREHEHHPLDVFARRRDPALDPVAEHDRESERRDQDDPQRDRPADERQRQQRREPDRSADPDHRAAGVDRFLAQRCHRELLRHLRAVVVVATLSRARGQRVRGQCLAAGFGLRGRVHYASSFASVVPISAGVGATAMFAALSAAILSDAAPEPPEMMAPACPMRLPGGAVWPAMNAATGFLT